MVRYKESETLELKKSTSELKEALISIVAILNKHKNSNVGVNDGVNDGVNSLFEYIKNNPGERVVHFKKHFNVSVRTIERWLNQLKTRKKIEFKGSSKIGGYYVK
jgi:predicted transcriptional regulator